MKKLFLFSALTAALLLVSAPVSAQYGQYGQPAPSESILVDKQVSKPVTKTKGGTLQYEFVDNLTPSDIRFQPGMDIYFKVRVKNTSSITLNNVMVADKVPYYLNAIEGPGTYDASTQTISFNAGTFAPNEEKVYWFKMQWFAQSQLPADKGLMCATNYVRAYTNNASDDDTAQACVEKQVLAVKTAPKAGPEMNILLVAGQLGLLGFGINLKKKAAKKTLI
jgi:uncharacterized repeat protein (TIGR01451 family)